MLYQEVIIIGAPRSGTNMLRDVLTRLPGFGTWPCDEINYIWRHGNARWPSDEFPPELATPRVRSYINRQFAKRARMDSLRHVVEKTCANSLRVPFVRRVLPDAKYIFIYRQSLDAIASATKRWIAPLDLAYTQKKLRFVPPVDIPFYAWSFIRNRLHRLRSSDRRLGYWGPRVGEAGSFADLSLAEICALQWKACVELSASAFLVMPADSFHVISYEDFVARPERRLSSICKFLEADIDNRQMAQAVRAVSTSSVGKGECHFAPETRERLSAIVAPARVALATLLEATNEHEAHRG